MWKLYDLYNKKLRYLRCLNVLLISRWYFIENYLFIKCFYFDLVVNVCKKNYKFWKKKKCLMNIVYNGIEYLKY